MAMNSVAGTSNLVEATGVSSRMHMNQLGLSCMHQNGQAGCLWITVVQIQAILMVHLSLCQTSSLRAQWCKVQSQQSAHLRHLHRRHHLVSAQRSPDRTTMVSIWSLQQEAQAALVNVAACVQQQQIVSVTPMSLPTMSVG